MQPAFLRLLCQTTAQNPWLLSFDSNWAALRSLVCTWLSWWHQSERWLGMSNASHWQARNQMNQGQSDWTEVSWAHARRPWRVTGAGAVVSPGHLPQRDGLSSSLSTAAVLSLGRERNQSRSGHEHVVSVGKSNQERTQKAAPDGSGKTAIIIKVFPLKESAPLYRNY